MDSVDWVEGFEIVGVRLTRGFRGCGWKLGEVNGFRVW